jgi:HEAT repeat protein
MKLFFILLVAFVLPSFPQAALAGTDETPPSDTHSEKKEEKIKSRFVGRVKWVRMKGNWIGNALPIGVEPKWLVAIDILAIEEAVQPFEKKGRIVILIHSPTRVLGLAESYRGKVYEFTITGVLRDGKYSYNFVEATEEADRKNKGLTSLEKKKDVQIDREESGYLADLRRFAVIDQNFTDLVALVHTEYPAAKRSAAADRLRVSDRTNPLFFPLVQDSNPRVRSAAINAVAVKAAVEEKIRICPKELIEALSDDNEDVRHLASNYLELFEQLPDKSVPLLLKALEHSDTWTQQNLAGKIYQFADAAGEAVPLLTKLLDHEDPLVRHNATVSLWYITHRPELVLKTNLELNCMNTPADEQKAVSPEVASAFFFKTIAEEAPKEVASELIRLCGDASPQIRSAAARLLGATAQTDKVVRTMLHELKTEEALQKLLSDPEEKVRRYAEDALQKLTE